jgi:toxin ParE1/3/4
VSLVILKSGYFWADINESVDWYREQAGPHIAERSVDSVEESLRALAKTPGLGRKRFEQFAELIGIRSWHVSQPFYKHLVFYRHDDQFLYVERLIHGARDLPRRIRESPYENK